MMINNRTNKANPWWAAHLTGRMARSVLSALGVVVWVWGTVLSFNQPLIRAADVVEHHPFTYQDQDYAFGGQWACGSSGASAGLVPPPTTTSGSILPSLKRPVGLAMATMVGASMVLVQACAQAPSAPSLSNTVTPISDAISDPEAIGLTPNATMLPIQRGATGELPISTVSPPQMAGRLATTVDQSKVIGGAGRRFVALDDPRTLTAGTALHLGPDALVLGLTVGSESRAYPLEMAYYHHVVNDLLGGRPVTVTY